MESYSLYLELSKINVFFCNPSRFVRHYPLFAFFIGAKVSDTIRKGIIDIEPYTNNTKLLMVGNVAALSGT